MKQILEHNKVKAVVTIVLHSFCHEAFFELGDDSISLRYAHKIALRRHLVTFCWLYIYFFLLGHLKIWSNAVIL